MIGSTGKGYQSGRHEANIERSCDRDSVLADPSRFAWPLISIPRRPSIIPLLSRRPIDEENPVRRGPARSRSTSESSHCPQRFSVELIVEFAWAIKTAIEYHRVFTNERSVQWLQTRRKPRNAHKESTVQRFGDRGPPDARFLSDAT